MNNWVRTIGSMILTGTDWSNRRQTCPSATLSKINPTLTELEQKPGRRLTASTMVRPCLTYIHICSLVVSAWQVTVRLADTQATDVSLILRLRAHSMNYGTSVGEIKWQDCEQRTRKIRQKRSTATGSSLDGNAIKRAERGVWHAERPTFR
jgi:hypothetical protein